MSTALVILAAGKGTRMKSDLPKVLHKIAHAPMLVHAMSAGLSLDPARAVVVAGHGSDEVTKVLSSYHPEAEVVLQTEQLGTAHAVLQARDALKGFEGDVVILYGDTPLITSDTLTAMIDARQKHDVVVLGFEAADPARYGRLVLNGAKLERIVEFKDASDEERAITLCNSGVIAADANTLFELLDQVGNDNAAGEYYLTDIVGLAQAAGLSATAVTCPEAETLGVNSRVELAQADAAFQARKRIEMMENGVTLMAPDTVYFAHDTFIGGDTVIEPNVVFGPGVTVENGATLRAFSHFEGCHISRGATVGPYARLRPDAVLEEDTHIGNFVEIKNATIAAGAKVNHLSYIGDAQVGERTNIGAGTITCNYDGVMKHLTTIGPDAFIGSNTMLIAPVTIGAGAITASGSIIPAKAKVPDGSIAVSRAELTVKEDRAEKYFKMLQAQKVKKIKDAS
jgi:bifunctional UDP-N-acetylglucosamine pyrophosphorylase/glucosamine-1-phosphate N-acetyltransferase